MYWLFFISVNLPKVQTSYQSTQHYKQKRLSVHKVHQHRVVKCTRIFYHIPQLHVLIAYHLMENVSETFIICVVYNVYRLFVLFLLQYLFEVVILFPIDHTTYIIAVGSDSDNFSFSEIAVRLTCKIGIQKHRTEAINKFYSDLRLI